MVASARKIIGATNPLQSEPGTIRGDFAIEVGRNVVHGSDSPENGEREAGNSTNDFVHCLNARLMWELVIRHLVQRRTCGLGSDSGSLAQGMSLLF